MKTDDVEVKDSEIQGLGVFATRDFKKGEVVLKWDLSNQISKEEYERLSNKEKIYVVFDEGKFFVMQEPYKFVNHSCKSNTRSKNFCDIAIKDIKKGEEITSNYNDDAPPNGVKVKCQCDCDNCVGYIKS